MTFRPITEQQARAVLNILVEECGHRVVDSRDTYAFLRSVATTEAKTEWMVCREYRFMGALGFGGKFRNNGNHDNTPHVDCYREDETPERLAMVERANKRLAELFGGEK